MKVIEFQRLTEIALCASAGTGDWSTFSEIIQADPFWWDSRAFRKAVVSLQLVGCSAGAGATAPRLSLQIADDIDADAWISIWSGAAPGTAVITLLRDVQRGQRYRLGNWLRWKIDFTVPHATTRSRISWRITLTAS